MRLSVRFHLVFPEYSIPVRRLFLFLWADGTAEILSTKATASRWEPNLKTAELDPKILTVICGREHIRLAALPCSDAIDLN